MSEFWTENRRDEQDGFAPQRTLKIALPKAVPDAGNWKERIKQRIEPVWDRFTKKIDAGGIREARAAENYLLEQIEQQKEELEELKPKINIGEDGWFTNGAWDKEYWQEAKKEAEEARSKEAANRDEEFEQVRTISHFHDLGRWRKVFGTKAELRFILSVLRNVMWRHTVYGDSRMWGAIPEEQQEEVIDFSGASHTFFQEWMDALCNRLLDSSPPKSSEALFSAVVEAVNHKGDYNKLRTELQRQIDKKTGMKWPGGKGSFNIVAWKAFARDYQRWFAETNTEANESE